MRRRAFPCVWLVAGSIVWAFPWGSGGPVSGPEGFGARLLADETTSKPKPDGDGSALTEEELREKKVVERFQSILEQNPRRGTALDRVFAFHLESGSLDRLIQDQRDRASKASGGESGPPKNADPVIAAKSWMIVGLLEWLRGEETSALTAFQQAERFDPMNTLASYYLGQVQVAAGNSDQAAMAFERALTKQPSRADLLDVFQALGRTYQRTGQRDKALEAWTRLEQQFPNDERVQEQIASSLLEEEAHDAALPRYEKLAAAAKDRTRQLTFRMEAAEIKVRLGNVTAALTEFESLLSQLNPDHWLFKEVRRRIEATFLRGENREGLIQYYQSWLEKHPEDLEAITRVSRISATLGKDAEAREWLNRGLKLAPSRRELRRALIDNLLAEGKYSETMEHFERLNRDDPGNPDTLRDWGRATLKDYQREPAARDEAATRIWLKLVEARPKDPLVASQVADLFRQARLTDAAVEQYRRAVELAPDAIQYREYLGEFLHSLKREDEALAEWRLIADGTRRTAENVGRLGEILSRFGYDDEAIDHLRTACRLAPRDLERRLKLVDLLERKKRYQEGLEELAVARTMATNDEEREAWLQRDLKLLAGGQLLKARLIAVREQLDGASPVGNQPSTSKTDPTPADQWYWLARAYEFDAQPKPAVLAALKAKELAPQSVPILRVAARLLQKERRQREAIEIVERLVAMDRRYRTEYLLQRATMERELGRKDEALKAGRELMAAAPENAEHAEYFARLCFQFGLKDEGLNALRRTMRANAGDITIQLRLSALMLEHGRPTEVSEQVWRLFEKSQRLDEKYTAISLLVTAHLRSDSADRVFERLKKQQLDKTRWRESTLCLAHAYQAANKNDAALHELESLLAESPRDLELLAQLRKLAEKQSDWPTAVKYQRQTWQITQDRRDRFHLAVLLMKIGETQDALDLLASSQSTDHPGLEVFKVLDGLYEHMKFEELITHLKTLRGRFPDDWELLYREGMALAKTKPNEAVERFERLLTLSHSEDEAARGVAARTYRQASPAFSNPVFSTYVRMMQTSYVRLTTQFQTVGGTTSSRSTTTGRVVSRQSAPKMYMWTPADFGEARMASLCWLVTLGKQNGQKPISRDAIFKVGDRQSLLDCYVIDLISGSPIDPYQIPRQLAQLPDSGPSEKLLYLQNVASRRAAELQNAAASGGGFFGPQPAVTYTTVTPTPAPPRPNLTTAPRAPVQQGSASQLFTVPGGASSRPQATVATPQDTTASSGGDVKTMRELNGPSLPTQPAEIVDELVRFHQDVMAELNDPTISIPISLMVVQELSLHKREAESGALFEEVCRRVTTRQHLALVTSRLLAQTFPLTNSVLKPVLERVEFIERTQPMVTQTRVTSRSTSVSSTSINSSSVPYSVQTRGLVASPAAQQGRTLEVTLITRAIQQAQGRKSLPDLLELMGMCIRLEGARLSKQLAQSTGTFRVRDMPPVPIVNRGIGSDGLPNDLILTSLPGGTGSLSRVLLFDSLQSTVDGVDRLSVLASHLEERLKDERLTREERALWQLNLAYAHWYQPEPLRAESRLKAIALLRGVSEQIPEEPLVRVALADLLTRTDRPKEALDLIDKISPADDDAVFLLESRAIKLAAQINDPRRIKLAGDRLSMVPVPELSAIALASDLIRHGLVDQAEAVLARSMPENSARVVGLDFHLVLLDILIRRQKWIEAKQFSRDLLSLLSTIEKTVNGTSDAMYGFKAANKPLRMTVIPKSRVEFNRAQQRVCEILRGSGLLNEMVDEAEAELAANVSTQETLQRLIQLQDFSGNRQRADELWLQWYELDLSKVENRQQALVKCLELNRLDAAKVHLREILSLDSANWKVQFQQVITNLINAGRTDLLSEVVPQLDWTSLRRNSVLTDVNLVLLAADENSEVAVQIFLVQWRSRPELRLERLARYRSDVIWNHPDVTKEFRHLLIPVTDPTGDAPNLVQWATFGMLISGKTKQAPSGTVMSRLLEQIVKRGEADLLAADLEAAVQKWPEWLPGQLMLALVDCHRGRIEACQQRLDKLIPVLARELKGSMAPLIETALIVSGSDKLVPQGTKCLEEILTIQASTPWVTLPPEARLVMNRYADLGHRSALRRLLLKQIPRSISETTGEFSVPTVSELNPVQWICAELISLGCPIDAAFLAQTALQRTERVTIGTQLRVQLQKMMTESFSRLETQTLVEHLTLLGEECPRIDPALRVSHFQGTPPRAVIDSEWERYLDRVAAHPEVAEKTVKVLATVRSKHPDDLGVMIVSAWLAAAMKDQDQVKKLAAEMVRFIDKHPLKELGEAEEVTPAQREQLRLQTGFWPVARALLRADASSKEGLKIADRARAAAARQSNQQIEFLMHAEFVQLQNQKGEGNQSDRPSNPDPNNP